jgi:propionyl-CoA synthetase
VPVGLVVLSDSADTDAHGRIVDELVAKVREDVGPVASFKAAAVTDALPKTRSGKTLRGIIKAVADGAPYTLPGTIEDASAVDAVQRALGKIGYPRDDARS